MTQNLLSRRGPWTAEKDGPMKPAVKTSRHDSRKQAGRGICCRPGCQGQQKRENLGNLLSVFLGLTAGSKQGAESAVNPPESDSRKLM